MARSDTQFKPGQSGNPGGRAKGIERVVRETVAELEHTDAGVTLKGWEAISAKLFRIAMGDERDRVPAAKLLLDRAYGQAKAEVKLTDGDVVKLPDMRGKSMEELRKIVEGAGDDGDAPDHVH